MKINYGLWQNTLINEGAIKLLIDHIVQIEGLKYTKTVLENIRCKLLKWIGYVVRVPNHNEIK
jgi:hypothetical protein